MSTGDEIAIGQLLDTNTQWLAERMVERGIRPVEHVSVGDDLEGIAGAIRRLAGRARLVIVTGGLGPTDGDLTRAALAQVMGVGLEEDAGQRGRLEAWLARRGRTLSERQARQAQRPVGAQCLDNELGTAPGLWATVAGADGAAGCDVVCLPGPPSEMRGMFAAQVAGRLRPRAGAVVLTRLLHAVGIPEADAAERLRGLTGRERNPVVGMTASQGVLTVRIRYEGADAAGGGAGMAEAEAKVRAALGVHVFGVGEERLAGVVVRELAARGRRLGVVESCTGGLLGATVTAAAGASAGFAGGLVTYNNGLKERLAGVERGVIEAEGAVSRAVCGAMARGGVARLGVEHAVAITGIAGPDGGSEGKPVGTVYVGHAWRAGDGGVQEDVRRFVFTGTREDIRQRAVQTALAMVYFQVVGDGEGGRPRLLWEVTEGR